MAFLNLVLLVLIVYSIFKWIWRDDKSKQKKKPAPPGEQTVEEMKQDPVCGTYVPASLAVTATHKGITLYFCSNACRDKFLESH
ncbi:MAG: YHS domain-containing protein [Candidatus Aminicenantes bacterium]|nr:YHS domain-containing protein [Candidatus Aminicenantes bacterium]